MPALGVFEAILTFHCVLDEIFVIIGLPDIKLIAMLTSSAALTPIVELIG